MVWQRIVAGALVIWMALVSGISQAQDDRSVRSGGKERTAAEKPYSRFCKARDLIGTWRLVTFTSQFEFKDPNAPYLMPHQLFQFSADGTMKSAYSSKPFHGNPAKVFQPMPSLVTYGFGRQGIVTVKAKGSASASETWHCVAVTKNRLDESHQIFLKRGDLVMTLIGKNGQAAFIRQLRKGAV